MHKLIKGYPTILNGDNRNTQVKHCYAFSTGAFPKTLIALLATLLIAVKTDLQL